MDFERDEQRSEAISRANKLYRGLNLYLKFQDEPEKLERICREYFDNVDEDIEFIKNVLRSG